MNEQKKLSFVLSSITAAHRNKKPLRNVNSGSVLKKLSRSPKAYFLRKETCTHHQTETHFRGVATSSGLRCEWRVGGWAGSIRDLFCIACANTV